MPTKPIHSEDLPLLTDTLGSYIRRHCAKRRIRLNAFSDRAGYSRTTFYRLLDGRNQPKLSDLIQLATAMNIHPSLLLRVKWEGVEVEGASSTGKKGVPEQGDAPADMIGFLDETIPDGTLFGLGEVFEKSWTIQNVGDTVWENRYYMLLDAPYHLPDNKYPDGLAVEEYRFLPHESLVALPTIRPSETYTLTVKYTTPNVSGRYVSYWKMVNNDGRLCFPHGIGLSVSVLVRSLGVGVSLLGQ